MKGILPEIADLLTNYQFAYLCTLDRHNQPHVTPMFFIFDPATFNIIFLTEERSKKVSNIKANLRVSITIDERDPHNPFHNRGVTIQGSAELKVVLPQGDNHELEAIVKMFDEKYAPLKERRELGVGEIRDVIIKVNPTSMTYWEGSKFTTIRFP